jgi:hypothetical protein
VVLPPKPFVPVDPAEVVVVAAPPPPGDVVLVEVEVEVEVDGAVENTVVVGEETVVVVVVVAGGVVVVVVLTEVALGTKTSPCEVWSTTPEPVFVDWGG